MHINYLNGCLYRAILLWIFLKFSQSISLSRNDKGRTRLRLLTIGTDQVTMATEPKLAVKY